MNGLNSQNDALPEKPSIEALYIEYYQRVYCRVMSIVHNPAVAEDITQDIFVKLCANYATMQTITSTWFYRVATNKAIDELRKSSRGDLPLDDDIIKEFSADPAETVEKREEVREVLANLKPDHASILIAHNSYGFKMEEIAQSLGRSQYGVKTTHMRAMHTARRKRKDAA